MLGLDEGDDLLVDLALGLSRAGKGGVSAEVLVVHGLQSHHVEVVAHAVAGQHGAGKLRCLFDVVGRAGGDGAEDDFLRRAAAGQGSDLIFQLGLIHQVVVALFHLHGVAQRAGGAGDDGDLLHRGRVGLFCRHKGVADLVVGHDALFLVGEDGVLLLVARDDHLDALLKVGLGHALAARADGPQGSFVDDVGQLGAGCTGGHPGHDAEIDAGGQRDLLGVDFQDLLAALQVGQLHGHPAVEAAGAGEGRVKGFRAVGGRQNDDAVVPLKTVHLGQKLVQGLFALVVAAVLAAVALLADGVDLVDEDDAGGLFLGLFEQVADLGSAHAHEHLDEFRTGHREEGHVGFTGHGLGQHGLAGARRADEQDALGHLGADVLVLAGVVQVVNDLLQVLLGLVLTGHIREVDALGGLDVDLGVGFSHAAKHHGVGAAHLIHELFVHIVAQRGEQDDGQHEPDQKAEDRRPLFHDLAGKLGPGGVKPLGQAGIIHQAGLVDLGVVLIGEDDLVGLDVHFADVLLLGHAHKGAVVHLFDLPFVHPRHKHDIEEQNQ